jgi:hypothetical protein
MKKLFLFCMAVGLSVVASAQKVYFLYLQTDDQAPFYVRMSDKIYSSAASGFLILPNLTDSIYTINVGFAKSTRPETKFAVAINQNDKGFLIKNFDDGLSLFNLQDLSIVKATTINKDNTAFETKSDKFSSILSKASDDPSLLKVPVAKKEESKTNPGQQEIVTAKAEEIKPVEEKPKDTVVTKPIETVETNIESKEKVAKVDSAFSEPITKPVEEIKQPIQKEEDLNSAVHQADYKPSIITRYSESSTTEGFGVIYFDRTDNKVDTIRILIPPSKNKTVFEPEVANLSEIEKKLENSISDSTQHKVVSGIEIKKEATEMEVVNLSSCVATASEKDFMKLRKNMAAKSNDEDMISEAKKLFRNKCFTSEQVRYLSTLFLTSAAKYQFFDAAFAYTSDKQNFSSLQSEIKDEYYLKRFKALIGE